MENLSITADGLTLQAFGGFSLARLLGADGCVSCGEVENVRRF